MKLAVIFNGQGAQSQNMGMDFVEEYDKAREVFEKAEAITDMPLRDWITNDIDKLSKTSYAQPAICATGLAIYKAVEGLLPEPSYFAGLSLGEYSSLIASGALKFDDGLQLLKVRGELMSNHCQKLEEEQPVAMAAAIKVEQDKLQSIIERLGGADAPLYLANINSSQQLIVAGTKKSLEKLDEELKEEGYRRTIPLKVEGPFHTPLMEEVQEPFRKALSEVTFYESKVPVISNTTLEAHEVQTTKELLTRHLIEPVHWRQTIDLFKENGVTHIVQIGPGNTLVQLLRREKDVPAFYLVDKVSDVEGLVEFLEG